MVGEVIKVVLGDVCESGGGMTMMATDCRRGLPADDDGNPYGNRPLFRTNWKKYAFGTEIGLISVRREKNCGSSNANNTGQIQCGECKMNCVKQE